jgi:hypothetical protein
LNGKNYDIEKSKEKMLIVFDDCFFSNTDITKCIRDIIYNGRHYNISIILSTQYPLALSPRLRTNLDYVFLFADNCTPTKKILHDHYAGMFPTFEKFKDTLSKVTTNYNSLVICNRPRVDDIQYYRANPVIDNPVINSDNESS